MGSRVELFEQIRRDRDREGLSIRALAARHGVHRRAVRQALASPVPPAKRAPVSRPAPKLGAYRAMIDEWLEADREAPRKQRHTAQADLAAAGRRARRRGRGDDGPRATCARAGASWAAGRRGVRAAGPRAGRGGRGRLGRGAGRAGRRVATTVHLFVMRASFSGAAFVPAFAGRDPAGVPGGCTSTRSSGSAASSTLIRYDNLTLGGQAGAEGPPAGRVRSLRRAALALPVRLAVHDAGHAGRAREGRRRGRGRPLPAPPSGPGPGGRATSPSSTSGCSSRLRGRTCARRIVGRADDGRRGAGRAERPLLRALPARARSTRRETATPRVDSQGAGHGPPEPLLGAGRAWPGCGSARGSARREITISHDGQVVARPRAAARPLRHQRPARSLPRAAGAQARRRWSTRWRWRQERDRGALARLLRRAVGGARPTATGARRPPGRWSTC